MSTRTRIKICGITRVEDGLAAAHAGADAIGLVFWPGTPRRIDMQRAREIVAAMPPFLSAIGLFVDPTAEEVRRIIGTVPLAALQFHGHEPAEFCRQFGVPYVKAIGVPQGKSEGDLLESASSYADAAAWLFDSPPAGALPGGTGQTFDWTALPKRSGKPIVLSGGLTADNVAQAIRIVRPWAVDVSSGVEALGADGKPIRGIKDASRIVAFVREVRNADT
ncbi:MAG TPA: phosphoribosylanthranilate isomerase [Casimicrobiaceae bacterium]|nr:phosphoribosylanthranilate isomerase [Casimicrobiaceae bacterium]